MDGADVHGDDGQVAGVKNFVLERELDTESIFSWSNNERLVIDLSSRGVLFYIKKKNKINY